MATIVYALNQSLDGVVDHDAMAPDPVLFRHFIEDVRGLSGMLYGRRMYEVMRYWDEEQPGWNAAEREYAEAWRSRPKWVVSRTLGSVGPNASLVSEALEAAVRRLKAEHEGVIEVAGPELAGGLTALGLIDEYRIYVHPVAAGEGKRYFVGPAPALALVANEQIGDRVVRLTYRPA
ncbi:dihydrofolate reductase family protein [Phenylobacterium sp. LjRoot225]|uniref:dihydrofolate reductase family protein n=1 Tax=Phenylobacterium sp. LjRoot225 TaxID=3342285 RepID=UPI003ECC8E0D